MLPDVEVVHRTPHANPGGSGYNTVMGAYPKGGPLCGSGRRNATPLHKTEVKTNNLFNETGLDTARKSDGVKDTFRT